MESFEEMKQRYQNDLKRYAQRSSNVGAASVPVSVQTDLQPPVRQAPPAVQSEETAEDRPAGENGTALLTVRTFTAREAVPLEGTLVIISRYVGDSLTLQWMGLTDISGNTPQIPLSAPDRGLSERPGDQRPYASYIIQTVKEGYYTAEFRNVPVFAGVSAVQPVEMIPLPVHSGPQPQMIVVERAPDL